MVGITEAPAVRHYNIVVRDMDLDFQTRLPGYVTFCKSLNLSVLQFLHL